MMVDREQTLVSVIAPGGSVGAVRGVGAVRSVKTVDRHDETAIWGSGETNELVSVLRTMFTWELDATREDE